MEKNTKTFRCDACKATVVLDFLETKTKEAIEKEMVGWVTLKLSALKRDGTPLIAEIVGHACSDKCVQGAFSNIVDRRLPEQAKQKGSP